MIPIREKQIKFHGQREYLHRVLSKWGEVKWTTLFNYKMCKYLLIKIHFQEKYTNNQGKCEISYSHINV